MLNYRASGFQIYISSQTERLSVKSDGVVVARLDWEKVIVEYRPPCEFRTQRNTRNVVVIVDHILQHITTDKIIDTHVFVNFDHIFIIYRRSKITWDLCDLSYVQNLVDRVKAISNHLRCCSNAMERLWREEKRLNLLLASSPSPVAGRPLSRTRVTDWEIWGKKKQILK